MVVGWGFMVVMRKLYQISSRKDSLVSVCLPVAFVVRYFDHLSDLPISMLITIFLFNDGEKGLSWTQRAVSSSYACT